MISLATRKNKWGYKDCYRSNCHNLRAKETTISIKMLQVLGSLDREVLLFNFVSGVSVATGLVSQQGFFSVQPLIPLLILPSILLQLFTSIFILLLLFPAYLLNTNMQKNGSVLGGSCSCGMTFLSLGPSSREKSAFVFLALSLEKAMPLLGFCRGKWHCSTCAASSETLAAISSSLYGTAIIKKMWGHFSKIEFSH